MKNALIKSFFKLYRPRRHRHPQPKKILVISTTGLGDTLWATPALRAIKKSWPTSFLGVLTTSLGATLLKNNPYIDQVWVINDPVLRSLPSLYRQLSPLHFDTAFIFHASQRPLIPFVNLLGPERIVGTQGQNKGLDSLLTHALPSQFEHEIQRRLRQITALGGQEAGKEMDLLIEAPFDLPRGRPLIAMHPGSKDAFKRWRAEDFIAVGRALPGQIVITGGQDEALLCRQIAQGIPGALSLAGQLNLAQMATFLKACDLFITNDTGPMHMAFALKTPTLALFGPTDHRLCGPLSSGSSLLQVSPCCSPCLRKKCQDPFCLQQISPSTVIERARAILRTQFEPNTA